jgi:hypothetical protein
VAAFLKMETGRNFSMSGINSGQAKQKNMCVYGHPTDPIFQPPTLTFY